MKYKVFYSMLLVFGVCALIPSVGSASENRIAVISMERVFEKHHKTLAANEVLKKRVDDMDKERQRLITETSKLKNDVESLSREAADGSLSEAEQEKKKELAREKYALYSESEERLIKFDRSSKNELNAQMRATQDEIVHDIREIVRRYVVDKNILLVIDDSGKTMNGVEAVVYFDKSLDITDAIIALLEKP